MGKSLNTPPVSNSEKRWYSEQDFTHFRKVMIRDAIECSFVIQNVLASEHDKRSVVEDFIINNCIGLEHLISRDVLGRCKDSRDERKRHARVVIKEHTRLLRSGSYSVERLASVSEASSKTARRRSRKFATLAASGMK